MTMSVEAWLLYGLLPLATTVIVPLGVLLHCWRAADARLLPSRPGQAEAAKAPTWTAAASAQLRRERIASALPSAAVLAAVLGAVMPNRFGMEWYSYLTALLSVLLCTAALLTRPPAMGRVGAQTAPENTSPAGDRSGRPPVALGARWSLAVWALSLGALVLAVCWAGSVSTPDDTGNYTMYVFELEYVTAGTTIAGWYFGVPVLVAAALLAALVLIALRLQAAPPLAADREPDLWLRRAATRTLLCLSGGAALVTLAWVLLSIGSAGQLASSAPSPSDGVMTMIASPLAPFSLPVRVLGLLLQGVGIALLMLPLLGRRAPLPEAAPADVLALSRDASQVAPS
jgi:hypothetical protein